MRLSILSVFSLVGAGIVSALPQESNLSVKRSDSTESSKPDTSEETLLTSFTGHGYEKSSCDTKPQCCTEANLLGGTLALGCSDLKK
ncbi:Hydrophobin [Penicillium coprophilum]|uniref:Hydrophobin n=1 Tax=Penicillium coprophilum TaxID=36646 RepID=UPI002396F197|nr:Hydrophobin [Penicillium coprophilum]KAJ5153712.1 Hydrophobin [Penicillium coprophilum]